MTVKTTFKWNFQSIATTTVHAFVVKYFRKDCGDLNEVALGNDDDKNDDDDDDDDDAKVKMLKLLKSAQVKQFLTG